MGRKTKRSLDKFYSKSEDPWGYRTTPDDAARKQKIIDTCRKFGPEGGYKKALDIGAGNCFVTADLPAEEIWGYEISDVAAERWPDSIKRLNGIFDLEPGMFDLVTLCGVLYPSMYDHLEMALLAMAGASDVIVTCNIQGRGWEKCPIPAHFMIHEEFFPYRKYTERLAVYKFE